MNNPAGTPGTSVIKMRSFDPAIIGSIFTRVDMSWSKDARAKFVVSPVGDLSLIRSMHKATNSKSRRLERHMTDEDEGHYFACLPMAGGVEIQYAAKSNKTPKACELKAGQLGLVKTKEEYEINMSDTLDALWLRIPAKLLRSHAICVDDAVGRPLDMNSGLGHVAKKMMYGVVSEGLDLPDRSGRVLSQSLLSFLGEIISSSVTDEVTVATRGRRKILERAQAFIEEHIHDDELNPALIARGIGISSRYLSEIFAAEGTSPMRWVRKRRLEMCRMELERQNGGQQLVCEIAYSMGFTNVSSFNRAFKAHFGHAPRALLSQKATGGQKPN